MVQDMKRNMSASIDNKARRAVYERDGFRCALCDSTDGLQIHHVKPRGEGGADHPMNLITLCWRCHAAAHGDFFYSSPDMFDRSLLLIFAFMLISILAGAIIYRIKSNLFSSAVFESFVAETVIQNLNMGSYVDVTDVKNSLKYDHFKKIILDYCAKKGIK